MSFDAILSLGTRPPLLVSYPIFGDLSAAFLYTPTPHKRSGLKSSFLVANHFSTTLDFEMARRGDRTVLSGLEVASNFISSKKYIDFDYTKPSPHLRYDANSILQLFP